MSAFTKDELRHIAQRASAAAKGTASNPPLSRSFSALAKAASDLLTLASGRKPVPEPEVPELDEEEFDSSLSHQDDPEEEPAPDEWDPASIL